ncbi:sodium:proton antiporter NhaD [Bradyrhizobium sp. 195]|uniref:sodium:proton antiporter NhaD n=1 Tax=Bradyrhizobium sp. 195 TaxID=2782662 RepID=UPI002000C69D|nr:sodium:proton antiporter NhaD [Bradyrhizobium sp. 195]UPK31456.1 sodium:proton antiporter NhaD [Bradyrhizobium sp. 195]
MLVALTVIFIVVYGAIALEHPIRIEKSASALFGAGLLWTIYALGEPDHDAIVHQLGETIGSTAGIIFFLMGAMTIVEVIDAHDGFEIITSQIKTKKLTTLMWLVCVVTFFLSAVLDNLTTTIVMVSLIRKLLDEPGDRLLFASLIVIAANAGGAWSPIGDVTTTMLWIGGQITPVQIVKVLFLASLANLLVPLLVVNFRLRGRTFAMPATGGDTDVVTPAFERNVMFALGVAILIMVPAFKAITHLPPFMGILFGLGTLWLVGEVIHRGKQAQERKRLTVAHALTQIDLSSIVFFLGILLAVATLEHTRILAALAAWLDQTIGRTDVIVIVLGLISAVVDNVPLVAASMGMYGMTQYPPDSFLWEFIAYCAGTGGSILIIGSAAGVAAMGLEKIQFIWYMRKISGLALLGYFAGVAIYILQHRLLQ